jgi:hypothetical protein
MNQRTGLRRLVLPALLAGAALLTSSAASAGEYHGPFHAGNQAQLVITAPARVPHAYRANGIVPMTYSQSRAAAAQSSSAPAKKTSSAHNYILPI